MTQKEIDEISEAFEEAWTDYFGDELYYVPFDDQTPYHNVYRETKRKNYRYDLRRKFHGTIKESPIMDELHQIGGSIKKNYEMTFVTKELSDQGVYYINTNDIITYVDKFGKEFRYKIYDEYQKVQLVDNKLFTKLKVIPYE